MNIVIANSQDWFVPSERLLALREPFVIGSKEELTESYLEKLEPEYVFFPHWNWIVPSNIHLNLGVSFSIPHPFRTVEEEARFKTS